MMMLINNIHNTLNTPFHPILTHDVVDNTINTLNTLSSNFNTHDVVNKQTSQADKVQETLTQQGLEEAGLETSSRFPSVDTLISEVPGTGWMSRSETANWMSRSETAESIRATATLSRARPRPERGLGRMRSWEQLEGETLTDFPLWRGIVIKAPQLSTFSPLSDSPPPTYNELQLP